MIKGKGRYLGYLVTVAIVVWMIFTIDWRRVMGELRTFDYRYLCPALLIYIGGFAVRGVRWQCMLAPLKRICFRSSFSVVMIGFMANNILPLRMGEVVRAWAIKRKEGISGSAGFATIVVERVYDGLALVGLLVFTLLVSRASPVEKRYGVAGAAIFLCAFGILLYAALREEQAAIALKRIVRILPGRLHAAAERLVDSFLPGLRFLSSGRQQAKVISYSFVIWLMEACVFWLVMCGFHMDVPVYASLVTLVIVNIAIMVPAGPGYAGTFEAAAVVALDPFGINKDLAIGFILVVHALQWLSVTALGLYFLVASGWSLREIERAEGE